MRWTVVGLALTLTGSAAAQGGPAPLTLERAIELGRTRGVTAALARENARLAEARVGQRRADLLPSVGASATYARQTLNFDEFGFNLEDFGIQGAKTVTDPFNIFKFQVHAGQTLVDPAAWLRVRSARDSAVASGDDARNAGALAGATAGIAWLRVFSAEETVKAREADSVVAGDLLEQARRSLEAGISAAIDLTRSGVNFGAIRSQLAVARNARDRARMDLARALDLPPGDPIAITARAELEPLPIADRADSAVAYALSHRADLEAERRRVDVLRTGRRAIRAENLPSLGASGYWQTAGQKTGDLHDTWLFQVGLTLPILDGFRRQARSQEQGIRIDAEEIRLHDLTAQVEAEARIAVLDLASAREQVTIAADRERLATEELRQAGERFAAGVAGSLETSNAQLSLTAARDALIQSRVAYGVARVSALRVLGMLNSERNDR